MNTNTELSPPSPSPATSKKGPGRPRKTLSETPQQRIERLQAELHHAQETLKLAEEKCAAIIGAAAIRHARAHENFRRQLAVILRAEVKSKADLAAVAEFLPGHAT